MAQNESADSNVATEEDYQYDIKIEDLGPATKKVVIDIPEDHIKAKIQEQYKEIRSV